MTNLLKETIELLAKQDFTPADVEWVGSSDGKCAATWADFAAIADFDYDDGFGGNEIPMGLVVVGADWWLERHEYDGSEWWEFKMLPVRMNGAVTLPPSLKRSLTNGDGNRHPTRWSRTRDHPRLRRQDGPPAEGEAPGRGRPLTPNAREQAGSNG